MVTAVIIPARYGSKRFPGKPLALINGVPMVLRVVERCLAAQCGLVYVATDDDRIAQVVEDDGQVEALTMRIDVPCGTDRVAVASHCLPYPVDVVINIQGDCPFIDPGAIRALADSMRDGTPAATLVTDIAAEDISSPHAVKARLNGALEVVEFSRYIDGDGLWYRHIGAYAYRIDILRRFRIYGQCEAEKQEGLEQLRTLEMGVPIKAVYTRAQCGPEINIPEDIPK